MISSIYDALILKMYRQHQNILPLIKREHIANPFPVLTTPSGAKAPNALMITPHDDYTVIPSITQPLNIEMKPGERFWLVDARGFGRLNSIDDTQLTFTARNDWMLQCNRLALMDAMREENVNPTRLSLLPAKVFTRWITLALAQRFNLPIETQLIISVLVALYYFQLINQIVLASGDSVIFVDRISAITSVPRDLVRVRLASLGVITDINDLCNAIKEHTGSSRLKDLNFTGLYMILANSWIGTHARENVGVALEHAPTLLALLHAAASEKSYRKTILSQRMESTGRQTELADFVKQIDGITRSYFT